MRVFFVLAIVGEVRAAAPVPRDEQLARGGGDLGFQYTVIPMAITGASETTAPGLGIS